MAKLEFRLVVVEDGKEVLSDLLSCELLSTIANYYPDKASSERFFKYASLHPSAEVRQQVAYKDKIDEDCRTSLSQDARFCPECGEKVDIFCTSCGASISATASFCGECGEKVATGIVPVYEKAYSGSNIALCAYSASLLPLKVDINSVKATGPDREKEYSLCIKFQVSNDSQIAYSSIFVSTQIYNSEGFIVEEGKEDFDEEIEAGDGAEFETYISSVKAGLLGDSPEGLKVVLNVYSG